MLRLASIREDEDLLFDDCQIDDELATWGEPTPQAASGAAQPAGLFERPAEVEQTLAGLGKQELQWMRAFFCSSERMPSGTRRPRTFQQLGNSILVVLEHRNVYLNTKGWDFGRVLNIKQVTEILKLWRAHFEEKEEQQQLLRRDRGVGQPTEFLGKAKSTVRLHRARSRFEQELRMAFHSPSMVKVILGAGLPDPRLFRLLEELPHEAPEVILRGRGDKELVMAAFRQRHNAVRGRKLSEHAYNLEGRCAHCGWHPPPPLIFCLYCGVYACTWCMGGRDAPVRFICYRCPDLDLVPRGAAPPAVCQNCHGLGIPPAAARAHAHDFPDWWVPVAQCTFCGLHLCRHCKHTEADECRVECPTMEAAPSHSRRINPNVVMRMQHMVDAWRSGQAEARARRATAEADEVAIHPKAGASEAAALLRRL